MAEERVNRTVEISISARDALDAAVALEGVKQKELMSRLIERFAELDRPSQQLFLGTLASEYAADAGERLKQRLIELTARAESANGRQPAPALAAKPTPRHTGTPGRKHKGTRHPGGKKPDDA